MTVLGVGLDLVEIHRIRSSVARFGERFFLRVFTRAEINYCGPHAERLAARFAAKEAVAKAFGTGIGAQMSFTEIEVVHDERGKPEVALHGCAAATARAQGVARVLISLTHTKEMAAAHALLLGSAP